MTDLTIVLGQYKGTEAAALMRKGRLEDLYLDTERPRPGTIYRAITERPVKGLGGMFVKTPDGKAFLRQTGGLSPGKPILVQVTGYAEPGKAEPVTRKLIFKSRFAIITPHAPGLNISRQIKDDDLRDELMVIAREEMPDNSFGLILRSSCAMADPEEIGADIRSMSELAQAVLSDAEGTEPEKLTEGDSPHELAWREWVDPADVVQDEGCFETLGVLDQIDLLEHPRADFPQGHMWIEPTRAMVSVDINTGGDMSTAAGLKCNLAAAKDLPRQLRLRGLGGQIIIDPAPMPHRDRRQFETALRAGFKSDSVETSLVGWTKMGLFELHRKRDRLPLFGGF